MASQAVMGPASLELNEDLLRVLSEEPPRGAGLDLLDAHDLVGVLTAWFVGHLANELPSAHLVMSEHLRAQIDWAAAPLGVAAWRLASAKTQAPPAAVREAALDRVCTLVPE